MRTFLLAAAALFTVSSTSAIAAPPRYQQQQTQYQQASNERVQISSKGRWYPGRVLQQRGQRYLVSYDGYGPRHNEWVSANRLSFSHRPARHAPRVPQYQQSYQQSYQQQYQQGYQQQYQQDYQQQYQQQYVPQAKR